VRVGDFSLEVVPVDRGCVRETKEGHVLARPGQVYRLRLRNHGPLRAVVHIKLDGHAVTENGLVLLPMRTTELERPIRAGEHGRFVVVAEGNERVFGPDGGRDNEDLGLIDAEFKRELPRDARIDFDEVSEDRVRPLVGLPVPDAPRFPFLNPPLSRRPPSRTLFRTTEAPAPTVGIAAGTGLTGHSDQEFQPVFLGRLEDEPTVVRLRLVVASLEEIERKDEPLPSSIQTPARPAARP
jgi:hypothetical protein